MLRWYRYLSINYKSSNFSISQCVFDDGASANILPFFSADIRSQPTYNDKAVIGGTIESTVFLLLSLIAFFVMRFIWNRRKPEYYAISSTSSKYLSPKFSTISTGAKEIGENSLGGFYRGHREMEAQSVLQNQSILLSQTGTRIRTLPKPPSSPASSGPKLQSPTVAHLARDSRQSSKWNSRQWTFERAIPPGRSNLYKSGASTLGRPLPLTPQENAAGFRTYNSQYQQH